MRVDPDGVVVRDHGAGVARSRISPTSSIASSAAPTRAGSQGSGLGLAIVRQVTEQHGGSVSVTNAAGWGAVFTPPAAGRAAEAAADQAPNPRPSRSADHGPRRAGAPARQPSAPDGRHANLRGAAARTAPPNTGTTASSSSARWRGSPNTSTIPTSTAIAGIAASRTVWDR